MYSRLQVADADVPPPINVNDVHSHALDTREAILNAVTEANCWSLSTDTGIMYGTWIAAAGKSLSEEYVQDIQPH